MSPEKKSLGRIIKKKEYVVKEKGKMENESSCSIVFTFHLILTYFVDILLFYHMIQGVVVLDEM